MNSYIFGLSVSSFVHPFDIPHTAQRATHTHTHTHLETASSVAFSQTSPACQGICLRRPHYWVEESPLCQMTGKAGSGFPPVDRGQTHAADGAL